MQSVIMGVRLWPQTTCVPQIQVGLYINYRPQRKERNALGTDCLSAYLLALSCLNRLTLTLIFGMGLNLGLTQAGIVCQGRRSKFKVKGEKMCLDITVCCLLPNFKVKVKGRFYVRDRGQMSRAQRSILGAWLAKKGNHHKAWSKITITRSMYLSVYQLYLGQCSRRQEFSQSTCRVHLSGSCRLVG